MKIPRSEWKLKHNIPKYIRYNEGSCVGEVYHSECRHEKIRDISNNLLTQVKAMAKQQQSR